MTRKFGYYMKGAVKLRVAGEYPERFINLCIADHIYLWGAKRLDDCMTVWICPADFFRIRPIVRKTSMRVKVVKRYGFPFFFKRMKQRKMLLLGAFFFFAAIYWLSGYVWFVEIVGLKHIPEEKVRAMMSVYDIRVGARQDEDAAKKLEKALLIDVPEVAWAGVHFSGTRAVVEIVEKVMPASEARFAGDLVASKDGVITECIAISGEKAVEIGDAVRAGDTLIRKPPASEGKTGAAAQAQGIVKARIVYLSDGTAYLTQCDYEEAGRETMSAAVNYNGTIYELRAADLSDYAAYEHERIVKKLPWWRNQDFAVELIIDSYRELSVGQTQIGAEEAKRLATLDALEKSKTRIPQDAYVVRRDVEELETDDPNRIDIRLSIETEEDIGTYIQYNKE